MKTSPDLPVPEVVEVGEAFGGAYAISARCGGINLEDVRPDQADAAGPMLASLLAALFKVPKSPGLPVGWHRRPPRNDLTWRGWLSERLVDDPRQQVHSWRAALAVHSDIDRIYRAAEARVRDLIDACPERRDLVHGDLLHAEEKTAFGRLASSATSTFGTVSAANPQCEMTPPPGSMPRRGTTATSCTSGSSPGLEHLGRRFRSAPADRRPPGRSPRARTSPS